MAIVNEIDIFNYQVSVEDDSDIITVVINNAAVGNLGYTSEQFDIDLAAKDTNDLTEGANLYFTDERVDDRVDGLLVEGSNITLTYDDGAGTLTIASLGLGSITNINDLDDVDTTGVIDLDVLSYNSGAARWQADAPASVFNRGAEAGSGITLTFNGGTLKYTIDVVDPDLSLNEIGDIGNVSGNLSPDSYLRYNSGSGLWVGSTVDVMQNDITNILITSVVNGNILSWNGFDFVNVTFKDALTGAGIRTTDVLEGTRLYFTDERVDDRVGNLLVEGANITLDYDDGANTLTITAASGSLTAIDDLTDVNTTGVNTNDILYFDGATWVDVSLAQAIINASIDTDDLSEGSTNLYFTEERVDDRVDQLLVGGSDITITYNDGANTLTINADSAPVTLAGEDYLTLSAQEITANEIDLDNLSATGAPSAANFLRGDNTWSVPAGSGDVSKIGTPVDNEIGVWTGDGTIEGDTNFQWSGSILAITGQITVTGNVDGRDVSADGGVLDGHVASTANPHSVTQTQVGLANVDNTSDANKPVSTAQQTALDLKLDITAAYVTADFTVDFAAESTTNLSEGTNLYYTTTRANTDIDARVTASFVDALDLTIDGGSY